MGARALFYITIPYVVALLSCDTKLYNIHIFLTSLFSSFLHTPQPRLGGDARPVQRPQAAKGTMADSSFDFLGKSSKGSAFDFVKEEIDSAKKK